MTPQQFNLSALIGKIQAALRRQIIDAPVTEETIKIMDWRIDTLFSLAQSQSSAKFHDTLAEVDLLK